MFGKKDDYTDVDEVDQTERKANNSSCDSCSCGTGIVVDLTCVRSTQKGKGGG